jgi:methanogenic corrinoid protein MtbC1
VEAVALNSFVADLIAGRREACLAEVQRLVALGTPLRALYVELIQAALHEVGRRWEQGEVSVTTEHIATAICEELLAQLFPLTTRRPASGRRALVSCAADEYHQLGGRIVADLLETQGWDVDFLGAGTSLDDLRARAARPLDLVALSCSVAFNLEKLAQSVRVVRAAAPAVSIIVGGLALTHEGDAWVARLGVPGVSHVGTLEALERLVRAP